MGIVSSISLLEADGGCNQGSVMGICCFSYRCRSWVCGRVVRGVFSRWGGGRERGKEPSRAETETRTCPGAGGASCQLEKLCQLRRDTCVLKGGREVWSRMRLEEGDVVCIDILYGWMELMDRCLDAWIDVWIDRCMYG